MRSSGTEPCIWSYDTAINLYYFIRNHNRKSQDIRTMENHINPKNQILDIQSSKTEMQIEKSLIFPFFALEKALQK